MMFGREKIYAERNWKRRLGYTLLGELHMPGRLRIWHVIKEPRRLGYWKPTPLSLLDAGGGEGAFAYYCARRFPDWQVVIADDEPETIMRGQQIKDRLQLRNLEVNQVDLLDLHAEPRYDVIVCSDVLEHIENDHIVMRNLARALKAGGIVLLTSPAIPQPKHLGLVAWHEQRIGFHPSQYGHVRDGYSVADVQHLFRHTGLQSETIRGTFGRCGTLMFDLFFVTGDSQPHPLVYMMLLPLYMGLSVLDMSLPIRHGAGILAVGKKP